VTQPPSPTRRKRKDAVQNRQRIMDAAREVFARRGFGATLDEVAGFAGVGVGTVYRHFANKTAVINALFEESVERLVELAGTAAAAPDPWEGFVGFIVDVARLQATDRGLRDLMLTAKSGLECGEHLRDRLRPVIRPVVARAQEQGALRPDFDEHDFPVLQVMLAAAYEFTSAVAPETWLRYLTVVIDGLCTRRAAPHPLPEPPLDEAGIEHAMRAWPATKRAAAASPSAQPVPSAG
jgi:AcrR family transcriptional regulator